MLNLLKATEPDKARLDLPSASRSPFSVHDPMQSSAPPRITIIIATFNAADTLQNCLQSIRVQRDVKPEVLVADGASTDTTCHIIRQFGDVVTRWWSNKDEGIYDAWNTALDSATGEYIMFLGGDDALAGPDVLNKLEKRLALSTVDLLTVRGQLKDSSGKLGMVIGTRWQDSKLPRRLRICHPGLLHHRSLFKRHGRFNSSFRIAGDLDFASRMPSTITTVDTDLIVVHIGDGGISRARFWQRIRECREIHKRNPAIGSFRAWCYWIDKAWRRPLAKLLDLPH